MRFLDLIKQHDRIRLTAHVLGKLPALVVADVSRRRTDQPRDAVFLHVFRHIDADHRAFVVEKKFRECLGKLGFPDTGRPQEKERADGAVLVLQARPRATHRVRHGLDRFFLTHHAVAEPRLHSHELMFLAFLQTVHRDARP